MQLFISLILVSSVALSAALSLPAGNRSYDPEVIAYPRRVSTRIEAANNDDFQDFEGVIDTESGYALPESNSSVHKFGFFDTIQDLFHRFKARFLPDSIADSAAEVSNKDNVADIIYPFDEYEGNSTSTIQIVDGHKVEVTETEYGDENSIYKLRVVNVRRLEENETDDSQDIYAEYPVTSRPEAKFNSAEDEEEDGRREPLENKPTENATHANIDDPEVKYQNVFALPDKK